MSDNTPEIEFRVKPLERYVVTRYQRSGDNPGVREVGTYTSPHVAYEVAYALAKAAHEDAGYPPGDERIQYPEHPLGDGQENPGCIS